MTEFTKDPIYEEHGFLILKNFLPDFFTNYLKTYFDTLKINNKLEKGDAQVENSECVYGDQAFDTFLLMSTPLISNAIKTNLLPTYTYGRIYYNGAELLPHVDREECQHSVTLFLGGEYDSIWPIWMMNKEIHKEPQMCALYPGDAVVYKGNKIAHWRDRFEGMSHYQLFLHFVETDGIYKDKLFDTRPYIGLSSSTKTDYGLSNNKQSS